MQNWDIDQLASALWKFSKTYIRAQRDVLTNSAQNWCSKSAYVTWAVPLVNRQSFAAKNSTIQIMFGAKSSCSCLWFLAFEIDSSVQFNALFPFTHPRNLHILSSIQCWLSLLPFSHLQLVYFFCYKTFNLWPNSEFYAVFTQAYFTTN